MIRRLCACLVSALFAVACGQPATPASERPSWEVTQGIATPESAHFDPGSGFIFSSQVDGAPTARDGNGRIVKISIDGKMVDANWATGFNAPKGLQACDGTLWTADLDEVVGITIATGVVATRIRIAGAQFLNDVACAGDTLFVSDTLASRIYSVTNGVASLFAEGEDLEYPNGLLVDGSRLIVGGWGKPAADFSTDVPGRLYALNLTTKAKTLITPQPFANIDGVESDGKGGYVISDYMAGTVQRVLPSGEVRVLRTFKAGAADIDFIPGTGTLIVPHMNENRVAAYDIRSALN